jgi:hypothetical protein
MLTSIAHHRGTDMNKPFNLILAFLLMSFAASSAIAKKNDPPEVSIEGLELVEKDRRGEIYADPDADWAAYTQVQLERASVAFRKNWKRDQNRYDPFKVKDRDVEKIKTGLSELFHEVFTEELSSDNGYKMADSTGEDVMTISPQIVDLDVYAPDTFTAGRSMSYTDQAGRMTLMLEIRDSVSGDLIAKASDRQEAPRYGWVQWSTSVSNNAEARRMLQRWAKALRTRLDEARGEASSDG